MKVAIAIDSFKGSLSSVAAGNAAYFPILRRLVTVEEALDVQNASANLASTVEQVFRLLSFNTVSRRSGTRS